MLSLVALTQIYYGQSELTKAIDLLTKVTAVAPELATFIFRAFCLMLISISLTFAYDC